MADSVEDFKKLREGSNKMTRMLMVLALVAAGVWWQFIRLPQQVEITKMVSGMNAGMTGLECWLTLDFNAVPDGDARDLVVVFEGEAVQGGQQRFDWDFIASHDVTSAGKRASNGATSPQSPPPVGQATKVNFPIRAMSHVKDSSYNMPLVATVYWGGVKQDSAQKSVGHAYTHESGL
jgi:hypothetical protein